MKSNPAPYHTKDSYDALSLMAKRLSKSQDFRTLGDELTANDSVMIMTGMNEAAKPPQSSKKPLENES